jgi:hypothetical protein
MGTILAECRRDSLMFPERCITAAVFKDRWWLLFHLDLVIVRMGLKDLNLTRNVEWDNWEFKNI